jgi:general secretion pathway protein M
MTDWFRQLEFRERALIVLAALIVVAMICWNFLWAPLQLRSADLAGAVADKTELVVDLRRAAALRGQGTGAVAAGAGSSLTVVINVAAQPLGLAIPSSTPVGSGDAIRVSVRDAPFAALLQWLDTLEQEYGVTVATADIGRTGQSGLVNGQIVLERS